MENTWPDFSLLDESGKLWTRENFLGSWWIIYIYPKDNTPGCTKQSCDLNSKKAGWANLGIGVLGISADSALSHQKFKNLYNLDFPLLVDDELRLIKALQAWKLKTMYGKSYWGIERTVFLVSPSAEIVWKESITKIQGHLERIEAAIDKHVRHPS